jgi:hypothetical protein
VRSNDVASLGIEAEPKSIMDVSNLMLDHLWCFHSFSFSSICEQATEGESLEAFYYRVCKKKRKKKKKKKKKICCHETTT